jgi:hypothetical protein
MSMIQVIDGYRMNGGHVIPKGYYETDALELMGIAPYLLENGHARYAEPPAADAPQPGAMAAQSLEDYDGDVIQVHQGYRVAEGKIIQPGVYRAGDPALYSKDEYLVTNRYATRIVQSVSSKSDVVAEPVGEPVVTVEVAVEPVVEPVIAEVAVEPVAEPVAEPDAVVAEEPPSLWANMSLDELKDEVVSRGMALPSRPTTTKLIAMLESFGV